MIERPRPAEIPDGPGSYQFYDADGRVIYVGKARSLRQRLGNYFQSPLALPPRTAQMVAQAARVEWIQVQSDAEALLLEQSLIKEHRPRFNVRLRDDKSYPWLAVTVADTWPRPVIVRGARRRGVRYFGPYPHVYAIRETLDLLIKTFPVRSCSDTKFRRHETLGRPCLLAHIGRCVGPCAEPVDPASYSDLLEGMMRVLDGDVGPVRSRLTAEMREAAAALHFERAARLRDRLAALETAVARQEVVTADAEDLDALGVVDDGLEVSVQLLRVRHGRLVGRRALLVDAVEDLAGPELLTRLLFEIYDDAEVPPLVLLPEAPAEEAAVLGWLRERAGRRVRLHIPQRGRKQALVAMARANAEEELSRRALRRASDHNARSRALVALQEALGLPEAPLRIECYDMSHLQGSDYVGSMVVMEDGMPKRSDYRRFKVHVPQNDDFAAMAEVLERRLAHLGEEGGARRRFAYPPQLILLDGGRGQLSVGVRALEAAGLTARIPIAALAKEFEEVWLPGRLSPVRIPRGSDALYLLQVVRDEAHRFAITYHRTLRARRMRTGVLEGIPGLGPKRRARLLAEMGGIHRLRVATLAQLKELGWLPAPVAEAVFARLHAGEAPGRETLGAETLGAETPGAETSGRKIPGRKSPRTGPRGRDAVDRAVDREEGGRPRAGAVAIGAGEPA